MEVILYDPMMQRNPADIPDSEWVEIMRGYRNGLLVDSDWTQMADAPLSAEVKAEWATYRQALRDAPTAFEASPGIVWNAPNPPGYAGDPERPPVDPTGQVVHILDAVWSDPEPATYHIDYADESEE